jgi:hypothetical protein
VIGDILGYSNAKLKIKSLQDKGSLSWKAYVTEMESLHDQTKDICSKGEYEALFPRGKPKLDKKDLRIQRRSYRLPVSK